MEKAEQVGATREMTPEEIVKGRFTYHAPKDCQTERYIIIREGAKALALSVLTLTPRSREQSVTMTKLDEVVMWANAAIARNE